jgi:peptidoglycan/xylan/chitin deacetylase (PgdA/CDA1 family)
MYHSVGDDGLFFSVTLSEFYKQMQYLKINGYQVLSSDNFLDFFKKGNFPPKSVLITFDDGYTNNYTEVYPILKKFNIPATIFLITGLIGKERKLRNEKNLAMMDWSQIAESSGIIDFQPHTVNHAKLPGISIDLAEEEISKSKKEIEEKLQKECRLFAYPSGSLNEDIVKLVKKNNFSAAFSVRPGFVKTGDDPFSLKRNSVDSKTTFRQFKNMLKIGKI